MVTVTVMTTRKGGRPKLPPTVVVKVGKEEYVRSYDVVGFSRDTPFRVVFQALVSKAEVAARA